MFEKFPEDFDWGSFEGREYVIDEYSNLNSYEMWRSVKKNDIVVDIGASVGPFAFNALSAKAKKVYCVEPSSEFCELIKKNNSKFTMGKSKSPLVVVNKAISDITSDQEQLSYKNNDVHIFGKDKKFTTITFEDFLNEYKIEKINFLKIDCEGGEYSILNEKYLYFLRNNVDFISCEVHSYFVENGNREKGIEKFIHLRDTFLSKIPRNCYKICCIIDCKHMDVTDWALTDQGAVHMLSATELMLYIKNK